MEKKHKMILLCTAAAIILFAVFAGTDFIHRFNTIVPSAGIVTKRVSAAMNNAFLNYGGIIFMFLALLCYIILMQQKSKKKLEWLAYKDALTGADNLNRLKIASQDLFKKRPDMQYAVVQFDIDNFKYINDMFGYTEGNHTLQNIVELMNANLQSEELVARVSNDYFALVLLYHGEAQLVQKMEKLCTALNSLNDTTNRRFELVISIGVYRVVDTSLDIVKMLDRAGIARKMVKGQHKTTYAFYDDSIRRKRIAEKQIENDMIDALKNHEFEVYFQPKYGVHSLVMEGAEALVRWNHPKKGLIFPDAFIPLFERNKFIVQLDLYVFEETCKKIRQWMEQGKKIVPISINLSRLHLNDSSFIVLLKNTIDKYHVLARYIELELTESAVFDNSVIFKNVMFSLHQVGFTVSMDDFGTGYSSLNMLKDIPVDVLKLDREFFTKTADDERGKQIVSSIVGLSKNLQINVVAEGVETYEQLCFLKHIGCDLAQGFYFAKPMVAAKFEQLLQ